MSRIKFFCLGVILVSVIVFLVFDFHYNRPLRDGEYPLASIDMSGIHIPMFSGISGPGFDFTVHQFFIWKRHASHLVPEKIGLSGQDQNTVRIETDQTGKRHYDFYFKAEVYNQICDKAEFAFSCLAAKAEGRQMPEAHDSDSEYLREKIALNESRDSARLKLELYRDPFSAVRM